MFTIWAQKARAFCHKKLIDLSLDDVEGDDSADFGDDGEDYGEEEEPDEARRLRRTADPPDEAGEEQGEAQGYHDVGENLE